MAAPKGAGDLTRIIIPQDAKIKQAGQEGDKYYLPAADQLVVR
jgi:hypothetical protein